MRFSGSCERGRAGRARHRRTGARGERREARGEGIVRLAEKHGIWVLSDEAYEHVLFDGREHVSAGALGYPKVVSVYSFSKSYAMSGLRLGYVAVGDATLVERMAKLVHAVRPEGAFYMWARIDEAWPGFEGKRGGCAMTNYLIEKAGVGSAPGEAFGPSGAGHIRFAYSCSTDQVAGAAEILGELLSA